MNALAVMLLAATFTVDYGWTSRDDGGVEYIIQIEPDLAEALRSGDIPEGVTSEIVPQVQNVRAFRVVIGNESLPRETIPANSAASTSAGAVPHTSMLAADTPADIRARYNFNPRYADPGGAPATLSGAVGETVENMRTAGSQAVNNAANTTTTQLQEEAARLRQGLEQSAQNGIQNLTNGLRGNTTGSGSQPSINPAGNLPAGTNQSAYANQTATEGNSRFSPNYGTTSNANQANSTQYAQQDAYGSQQPQYAGQPAANWPPQQSHLQNQEQWPQANTNNVAQQGQPSQTGYAGQSTAAWPPARDQNNWQAGATPQQQPTQQPQQQQPNYQNQAQTQPNNWQQQQPAQQQPNLQPPLLQPPYQQPYPNGPYQNPNPQTPPLYATNPYLNGSYAAGTPGLNPPLNNGGNGLNVQPVSQPAPPANPNPPLQNQQPTSVARNVSDDNNANNTFRPNDSSQPNASGGTSISRRDTTTTREKADPDTVAWVAMWLLLLSISGNLFLGYIASNFQKQTRKMAMQLRRVRT